MVQVLVMFTPLPGPGGRTVGILAPLVASVTWRKMIFRQEVRGEWSRTNSVFLYLSIFVHVSLFYI